jgi:hypothetical protein
LSAQTENCFTGSLGAVLTLGAMAAAQHGVDPAWVNDPAAAEGKGFAYFVSRFASPSVPSIQPPDEIQEKG